MTARAKVGCVLTATAVAVILPIAWLVLASVKTRVDTLARPPVFRFTPTTAHYRAMFVDGDGGAVLLNSAIVASVSTALAFASSLPVAYVLARSGPRPQGRVVAALLGMRIVPVALLAVPWFLASAWLGAGGFVAVIAAHTTMLLPVAALMLGVALNRVPRELDEAATLDGDSRVRAVVTQLLPAAAGSVIVTVLLCFTLSWGEFFLSMCLTDYPHRTLPVAVPSLVTPHGVNWGGVSAIATVAMLPAIVAACVYGRYAHDE